MKIYMNLFIYKIISRKCIFHLNAKRELIQKLSKKLIRVINDLNFIFENERKIKIFTLLCHSHVYFCSPFKERNYTEKQ